jgi:PleD family two-component response regulator
LKIEDYDVVARKYGSIIARQMVDAVVPALQKVLRELDILTKLDNGELVIMLPGSTQSEVSRIIKKMHAATASCVLPMVDRELSVRYRHGVAQLKANETAQEMLARARQAMSTSTLPQEPQPAGV